MTDMNIDGSSGAGEPREGLAQAAATVKAEAAHFAAAAGDKVQEKFAEGQTALGGGIHQFADALRQAGENLGQQDQSLVSGLVKQAADGLESVSRVVADKRPDEMLRAVRDFGRDNPAALIAASVLAGVALGRLARASGEHVHAGDREGPSARPDAPSAISETNATQANGARTVTPDTALADTASLSVLGNREAVEADDADIAQDRSSSFRDDREV